MVGTTRELPTVRYYSSAASWPYMLYPPISYDHTILNVSLFFTSYKFLFCSRKALPLLPRFFLCIFSSLTCLKKPVPSKRDLLRSKVLARLYWDFTNQPVTISKKWKNPSYVLRRKRTWVQALPWFSTCSLGLRASGADLKITEGLMPFSYTKWLEVRE